MKKKMAAMLLGLSIILSACGGSAAGEGVKLPDVSDSTTKIETVNRATELLSHLDNIKLDEMAASYSLALSGLTSSEYNGGAFADGAEFSVTSEGRFEMSGRVSHDVSTIKESYYMAGEDKSTPTESSYEGTEEHYSVFSEDRLEPDGESEICYQYTYSKTEDGWAKSAWSYEAAVLNSLQEARMYTELEIGGKLSTAMVEQVDGYEVVSVELPGSTVASIGGSLSSEYASYMLALVSVDTGIPVSFYFKGGELSKIHADYNGNIPAADSFGIITRFYLDIEMDELEEIRNGIPAEVVESAVDTGYGGTGYTYEELLEANTGLAEKGTSILSVFTGKDYEELPSRAEIVELSNGALSIEMDEDLIDLCGYIGVFETSESFAHYYLGDEWEVSSDLVRRACATVYKAGWVEPELFTAHGVSIEELEEALH